jgi:aminoglycoside phosphotransferase family enzyme/predicted kinase
MAKSDMAEHEQDLFRQVCDLLTRRDIYPDSPAAVEIVETHISCVFLSDTLVYKLKKPVRFEFVDFSTLGARRQACEDEVRLNRRLARDIYLGVEPITREATGQLALNGDGEPVDWVVKMRRLPSDWMLDARVRAHAVSERDVANLAQVIGDFYAAAPAVPMEPAEYCDAIHAHVRANLADLSMATAGDEQARVRRAHAAQLQFLALHAAHFNARVEARRIVDGHGDLRPEHVCLSEPPVVFDCLEFDARLRTIDIADELSFFVMECERLGAAWIGQQVREACLARCGDAPPAQLLYFYQAYRACVRGKVAALRANQLSGTRRADAVAEVAEYLQLAESYGRRFARPVLIVVSGLMGSGKSTLARELADKFTCQVLQTDELRRKLLGGSDVQERTPEQFDAGRYSPANRQRVYEEMFSQAAAQLGACSSVILDGTFVAADLLRRAAQLGSHAGATLLVVRCHCPAEVARTRIAGRLVEGRDASEARPELHEQQQLALESVPDEIAHVEIDTTLMLTEQTAAVIQRLRELTVA